MSELQIRVYITKGSYTTSRTLTVNEEELRPVVEEKLNTEVTEWELDDFDIESLTH